MDSVCAIINTEQKNSRPDPAKGGSDMLEFLPWYLGIGFIILIICGVISQGNWRDSAWVAVLWPLWVGFLLLVLFYGKDDKKD